MQAAILVILGPATTALLGLVVSRRFRRVDVKTQEIHILVNSKMTEALDKVDKLEKKIARLEKEKKDRG